jgi:ATP-dependent DNA helicase RecG
MRDIGTDTPPSLTAVRTESRSHGTGRARPGARTVACADPASLPVSSLRGVGPHLASRLARLGIRTVQDLLFHLPTRYEDRTRVVPIDQLREGERAVAEGMVQHAEVCVGRRRSLVVRLGDGTGQLMLRFFHFNARQRPAFENGVQLRCYGEVRRGRTLPEMIHPEYQALDPASPLPLADHLTPVYPASEGIQQATLRSLTTQALSLLEPDAGGAARLRDLLPAGLAAAMALPSLSIALHYLHRPPRNAPLRQLAAGRHPAQRRLALEEMMAHHLCLRRVRNWARQHRAPAMRGDGRLTTPFVEGLAFRFTPAQQRVASEIRRDLQQEQPMLRLLQGDVGAGKTVVAAFATLMAVEAGLQVAIMAPTELLAEQHYESFRCWLEPLGVEMAWLSGRSRGRERVASLSRIREGTAAVAVGTHALFQEEVEFHRLGLVIVDEQHRFGVHQRLALRDKGRHAGAQPHQLIMTATPIPRTLAMAVYADLDLSLIDELPPGRVPVRTAAVGQSRREEVIARVRQACAAGRQAYWVCTLIEESEALECQAAAATATLLAAALPELRIALVHGRLKADEKGKVMARFKAGEVDLLVATTVIEVGVDVPNASLMIIENAERLGLAQLHQLRGRVGRGSMQSSCVLLYQPPLSATARRRLSAMRDTSDGFRIAEHDLRLRGPGEVLGTRQTGEMRFHIADLVRDQVLLPAVSAAAERLLSEYPENVPALIRRWLGDAAEYGRV